MNGRLVARAELREADVLRMYRLLDRHFAGVDPEGFRADLAGKDWVVLLEDGGRDGAGTDERAVGDAQGVDAPPEPPEPGGSAAKPVDLVGFSTFRLDREVDRGRELTVVYSGDTIVDPAAWGTPVLPRTWIRSVRSLHRLHGSGPLLWLLITSGFRTYRFLPVFCRTYHAGPSRRTGRGSGPDAPDPDGRELGMLAERLARRRFGGSYDPESGIVRLARPQRLRDPLLDVPAGRLDDPHVRRFLALNPGHADGDELVCLAPLGDDNLTRAGRRMLHGRRRRPARPEEGRWTPRPR